MTKREKKERRDYENFKKRQQRIKKKSAVTVLLTETESSTPNSSSELDLPASNIEISGGQLETRQIKYGKKMMKRKYQHAYRLVVKLHKTNDNLERLKEIYRKRATRAEVQLNQKNEEIEIDPIKGSPKKTAFLSPMLLRMVKRIKSANVQKMVLKDPAMMRYIKKYSLAKCMEKNIGVKLYSGPLRKAQLGNNEHAKKLKSYQLRKKIEAFFVDDKNSRITTDKKDTVTFKKVKKQRRVLLDRLDNLHKTFITEVQRVSYSVFCKSRPFFVTKPKIRDRESCLCTRHENASLKFQKLRASGVILHNDVIGCLKEIVCDFNNADCCLRKCKTCKDKKLTCQMYEDKVFFNKVIQFICLDPVILFLLIF